MKPPENMTRIVDRVRYSTATAELIAGDDYWDGHNFERRGTNRFLYRTPRGRFFVVRLTQWQGEQDTLTPVSLDEAITEYERHLTEHYVEYDVAFPEVVIAEG